MRIEIHKQSFEVRQFITGVHVLTVNEHNLFGIEPVTDFPSVNSDGAVETSSQSMSLDFSFPSQPLLFGLPERNDQFIIKDTLEKSDLNDPTNGVPYRMFANDLFEDAFYKNSLYGVISQVIARCDAYGTRSAQIVWNNASDTFADVFASNLTRTVHFMSESG
jgi:hypothetical protein